MKWLFVDNRFALVLIAAMHLLSSVLGGSSVDNLNATCQMETSFLYFGYGSNLLAQRIHINNPSAVRVDIGKLKNYRLDFNKWSRGWGGSSATIVPDTAHHVWGAVWQIDACNLADLDRQEGVATGWYTPIQVNVVSPTGVNITCRSYQMNDQPPSLGEGEVLPVSRRPSPLYREVIIQGAYESGLPEEYIKELKKIPDNGYKGANEIGINLPITNTTST